MARSKGNAFDAFFTNQPLCQQSLFSLVSVLCPPRSECADSEFCRLIVDSRLEWAREPIDGESSWLYLPVPVRVRMLAGCTVIATE
jgi:hypothetical protein